MKRVSTLSLRTFAAAAVVLGVASCGNGELSRSEYVQRVNKICTDANAKVAAIAPGAATDPQAVQNAITQLVKVQRDELTKIEAVSPARDDRDLVREWIESVNSGLDKIAEAANAVKSGDRAAYDAAVQAAADANNRANERATRLGLTACVAANPTTTTATTTTTTTTSKSGGSTTTSKSGGSTTTTRSSTSSPSGSTPRTSIANGTQAQRTP